METVLVGSAKSQCGLVGVGLQEHEQLVKVLLHGAYGAQGAAGSAKVAMDGRTSSMPSSSCCRVKQCCSSIRQDRPNELHLIE